MAMCDYYLCDVCGQKCFYDAAIAEYDDAGRYLLSGRAIDIAAICESCAKTHKCIVVPLEVAGAPELLAKAVVAIWNMCEIQDADDWLYVARNTADAILRVSDSAGEASGSVRSAAQKGSI